MLKLNSEFQRVYKRGKSAHSTSIALFYLPVMGEKQLDTPPVKKWETLLFAIIARDDCVPFFAELSDQLSDGWYVLVAKEPLHSNDFETVRRDCKYVLKRTGALIMSSEG